MSDFDTAFQVWRAAPFPQGSQIDVLDDLHADLALYDSWVAEAVIPYADHGEWTPSANDVVGAIASLKEELEAQDRSRDDAACSVAAYLSYAGLLAAVYLAFLRLGPAT